MMQKSRKHIFKILNTTDIQMYYLVTMDYKGMAAHLTRSYCDGF